MNGSARLHVGDSLVDRIGDAFAAGCGAVRLSGAVVAGDGQIGLPTDLAARIAD